MKRLLAVACATIATIQLSIDGLAAEPAEVNTILSNVPVFVPSSTDGKALLIKKTVNKREVGFLFAAMSPAAASVLMEQVIRPAEGKRADQVKFNVIPLPQLRETLTSLQQQGSGALEIAYVPDPSQEEAAVSLMTAQGIKPELARGIARTQPIFFCPEPLITVTTKEENQSYSPCGQDFVQMALLVLNPGLKGTRPGLQAVPIEALEGSLMKQPSSALKGLVLLPTAATEKTLQNGTGKAGAIGK